jgi:exopolyphosphatase / guanosine-5'-triphosphate,3'-diphosphate pyrophosphatase
MAVIIPRWEWRSFGTHFGGAVAVFEALGSTGVTDTDESYLLSSAPGAPAIVKVRFDLMDIKILREVDDDGLERWEPVLKAGFPMSADDVARVADALHIAVPTPARETYTLAQFMDEVAGPSGVVRAVDVHKHRVRYTINGCSSEVSDVTAAGLTTRTIAIESTDAAAVVEGIKMVGLDGYTNTNYPRGVAALLDGTPERYAVLDVGTNSIKFQVSEVGEDGLFHSLVDRAEVTQLGQGIDQTGEIAPEALARATTAIDGMAEEAKRLGVRAIVAVGTAGLRAAANRDAVTGAIHASTGVMIRVIPGQEEGRLAFTAVEAGLGSRSGSLVVFDTGGGSSQFTFGQDGHVLEQYSVPVGAVRFTERFGLADAVTTAVLDEALAAIAAELSSLDGRPHPDSLVGMGGAITNITAVQHQMAKYDPAVVQGSVLQRSELDRQIELYRGLDADGRRSIIGLQPKRAEVILAGACIVRTVMDKLGQTSLTVSDRGLRHGVLAEWFGRQGSVAPQPRRATSSSPRGS